MAAEDNINYEENFIKRERRKKKETEQKIKKLRDELPIYTIDEIRKYRMPYCQSVLFELKENNYMNSAEYLAQLFDHEEQQRLDLDPNSIIWTRPLLAHTDDKIQFLKEALVRAEKAFNDANYETEVEEILKATIHFAFTNGEDWWWLAEQLLLMSVDISIEYQTVENRHQAWSRFILSKFLIENAREYGDAEFQLNIVRDITTGKSWNMKPYFPDIKDTLFMNTNRLLYFCAIREAKIWAKTDKVKATQLALNAKKRASEACYRDGETEALLLKGQCELEIDPKAAISSFNRAYYIQHKLKCAKGMCEARVQLSKAYLVRGTPYLALQNLIMLKETAESNNLPFYLAQAYRFLGEYYLNKGEPYKATPLLADALDIFHDHGNVDESEQVRNLQAISAGLELMPEYISLLMRTNKQYPRWFSNVIKMVEWKDLRESFWDELDEVDLETQLDTRLSIEELMYMEFGSARQSETKSRSSTSLPILRAKYFSSIRQIQASIEEKTSLASTETIIEPPPTKHVQLRAATIIELLTSATVIKTLKH